jgi:hypothetical protein
MPVKCICREGLGMTGQAVLPVRRYRVEKHTQGSRSHSVESRPLPNHTTICSASPFGAKFLLGLSKVFIKRGYRLSRQIAGLVLVAAVAPLCLLADTTSTATPSVSSPCLGTPPVIRFRLLVEPRKGGEGLRIDKVNMVQPGEILRYEPVHLPITLEKAAKIAIILTPDSHDPKKSFVVLESKAAKGPAEWMVPMRASAVGVVFGPRGLDVKKVNSLVARNPELLAQLEDYAQQTATMEGLVQTLSEYEQAPPGTKNLNAMLNGFSSEYGVAVPRLDPSTPGSQQASMLLQTVLPTLSSNSPAASSAVAQSTSLATSVAAMFFGSPVGLAAGGAALFEDLHAIAFPNTDFHPAFAQPSAGDGLALCSKDQKAKPRTHVAYLWMQRIPDAGAPSARLANAARVPIGWNSEIKVTCETSGELRLLPRARDWRLVSASHSAPLPVTVTVGNADDTLSLDLTHAKLPPGEYQLSANWDWSPLPVEGKLQLVNFDSLKTVKLTPDSQNHLIAGIGPVPVELTGADFEFVDKLAMGEAGEFSSESKDLPFKIERNGQDEAVLRTQLDTSSLHPGKYLLTLTQLNGAAGSVPIQVLPPVPKIENLPLRINFGEPKQTVVLKGKGLGRILSLQSDGATWKLAPVTSSASDLTERQATVELQPAIRQGALLAASMAVEGMTSPLKVPEALRVVGPRPKIAGIKVSFPGGQDVALAPGEIPAGSNVSFVINTENVDSRPTVSLSCQNSMDTRQSFALRPGDSQPGLGQLDEAGQGLFFLSVNPGAVGQSGCLLQAVVATEQTGTSNPFNLGKIIRLPVITKFVLTNRKVGASLYEGILTGQDLQIINKAGWNSKTGYAITDIPTPVPGNPELQTLKIQLPWPPPAPNAPVFVWLRGESQGRMTKATY